MRGNQGIKKKGRKHKKSCIINMKIKFYLNMQKLVSLSKLLLRRLLRTELRNSLQAKEGERHIIDSFISLSILNMRRD